MTNPIVTHITIGFEITPEPGRTEVRGDITFSGDDTGGIHLDNRSSVNGQELDQVLNIMAEARPSVMKLLTDHQRMES